MNHVWHTRILVSCIAIAAVIDAGEEALSRAPHVVAKLPDLWWLHYAPLSLLSIAAILWIVRLLQNWTSPNIKPQAQTQPLKPAIELAPSKLRIHSASYAPIDGEGDDYPVAEFLSQITNGDSLVLDNIQNQSFQTRATISFLKTQKLELRSDFWLSIPSVMKRPRQSNVERNPG